MSNSNLYILDEYGFEHDVKYINGVACMYFNYLGYEPISESCLDQIRSR